MSDEITTTRKAFPNGDIAVDEGNGLVYHTSDALYTVELAPPSHPLSDEPFGVDLVRTTRSAHGWERQQRLTLAEYRSYMSAEEHIREVEGKLLDQGRDGLPTEMALVDAMPYEPDTATYLVGLYPPVPGAGQGTLRLIRLDGECLDTAPVASGPAVEMAAIEQRLLDAQAEGDADVFLKAATVEAVRARVLAPGTPLFAPEGEEMTVDKTLAADTGPTPPESEDPPGRPGSSAWGEPPLPPLARHELPVTFDEDMVPFDASGRYVPHHRDETDTVHFFSVVERPSDSPLPEDASHEVRYFRARKTDEEVVIHDSQPVMPVAEPGTSPWPLPALNYYLEEGELEEAQALVEDTARIYDLTPEGEPGWVHFDAALVLAAPQGVDDGYSVGVVDVYANREDTRWAARYLPMGEFDTLDDALNYELQLLQLRTLEQGTASFQGEPALYERIALAEADAALTDLLERHDGHLPPDYDGDHEPEWEPLTSKEWEAYRDYVQMITETNPAMPPIRDQLPTATPQMADDVLIAGSAQPDSPYLQGQDFVFEDFKPQDIAPTWQLDVVPARDPDGEQLGHSAVCVVDFADLAEAVSPDAPQRAQWLEVAQFQTEERANQFRDDFLSLVGNDELGNVTGPALAGVIADDLHMDSQWQVMNGQTLEELKAGEWHTTHETQQWHPRLDEISPNRAVEASEPDIDL